MDGSQDDASSLASVASLFHDPNDYSRPSNVTEYICTSRLARAATLLPNDSVKRTAVNAVLAASQNLMPAEQWFAADPARGACPHSLTGQMIGELHVVYPPPLIAKQRRYASGPCIFSLPKEARYAATYGLYVDGDLVGSELTAYQHICCKLNVDCDNLDDHLDHREAQLAALGKSHAVKHSPPQQRDFAKKYGNLAFHGGALKPSGPHEPKNAIAEVFEEYDVLPTATPPLWLINLSREMAQTGPQLMAHPSNAVLMAELQAKKPQKAARWQSAIHYLAGPEEYAMIDAALEYGDSIGLKAVSDQSDGYLWLVHSFPPNQDRNDIFEAMTDSIRMVTGISTATIREKPISLPVLPAVKTARLDPTKWPSNAAEAHLPELNALVDRHFVSIMGMTKAYVAERQFYEGTDIVSKVILRTELETRSVFRCCSVIIGPADKAKKTPIFESWLLRCDRPFAQAIDFLVTHEDRLANPDTLSSFTGLRFDSTEPLTNDEALLDDGVRLILDYIHEILAADNLESSRYILGWLAACVQRLTKIGVIMGFVGAAGCGKSHLFTQCSENLPIFQTLFGGNEGYYMSGQGLDDVVARFNTMSSAKLFAVCEELKAGAAKENMAKLKFLADAKYMTFEAKHADAVRMADHRNTICITNYEDAFGVDGDTGQLTRKLAIFEPSDKYCKANRDADAALDRCAFRYFKAVDDAQRSSGTQQAFYWYLKTYDLSDWRPYGYPETPIMTRYLAAANPVPLWFAELMEGDPSSYGTAIVAETLKHGDFVTTVELYQNLTSWAKLFAPSLKMHMPAFEKAIAAFASQNPAKLRRASVRTPQAGGAQRRRGYVDPTQADAASHRRAQHAAAGAVHRAQFDDGSQDLMQ